MIVFKQWNVNKKCVIFYIAGKKGTDFIRDKV